MSQIALAVTFLLGLSLPCWAGVLFQDRFETEFPALNHAGFAKWDVVGGTVDVHNTFAYYDPDLPPQFGLFADLDGSTNQPGTLITKRTFRFLANTVYTLSFDLAGNNRHGGPDTVTVYVGTIRQDFTVYSNDPFIRNSFTFSSPTNFSGRISFRNSGNDNLGALLDNVRLDGPSSMPWLFQLILD